MRRNDLCWCGSKKKWKQCHWPTCCPKSSRQSLAKSWGVSLKCGEQLTGIRRACQIAAQILDELCARAVVGVQLLELDAYCRQRHLDFGATPAPLHYGHPPFPASLCISINEVVCHGIPGSQRLQVGDILNIDVTAIKDGYFGDCSKMVMLNPCSEERRLVTETSRECLELAIKACRPGATIGDIGQVIENHAHARGCSVVDAFVGHGIGLAFHEPPNIPHFANKSQHPFIPGMVFTIEPMINAGLKSVDIDPVDKWTAKTSDKRASAQWEHTLLIDESGCEVLTKLAR